MIFFSALQFKRGRADSSKRPFSPCVGSEFTSFTPVYLPNSSQPCQCSACVGAIAASITKVTSPWQHRGDYVVITRRQESTRPLNPTDPSGSEVTIQSSLDQVLSRPQRPKKRELLSFSLSFFSLSISLSLFPFSLSLSSFFSLSLSISLFLPLPHFSLSFSSLSISLSLFFHLSQFLPLSLHFSLSFSPSSSVFLPLCLSCTTIIIILSPLSLPSSLPPGQ